MRPETKQQIVSDTLHQIGAPDIRLSPGSTELKGYLIAINDRLGLTLDTHLSKPKLAEAIAQKAGISWDKGCWSAGSTVTVEGNKRVREAVQILLAES